MTDFEAELRKTIQEKRAVLVAGTGVSIAASRDPKTGKPHPQASWAGLLESGLEWLEKKGLMTSKRAEGHRALLAEDAGTHHFITAAQDVTDGFGGQASGHFEEWLKRTVGSIQAHDRTLLDALEDLRRHGNLLATTNYDGLLLGDSGKLSALTWEEKHRPEFLRAVRTRETDKILFLHGFWRRPSSVILDWSSYQAISSEGQYRDDLRAFWQTSTWIFVGCGVEGLRDPDLGLLLKRYGARHRKFELWDFCLVRASQREAFQAEFDKRQLSLRAVSFGADFDDLPNYLRSLLPTPISLSLPPLATARSSRRPATIPLPPAFHAEPDYIGSHGFVGRVSQLEDLDDWAKAADPANLLLFEAIGGNGKSMLTWEWARNRSTEVRDDWAGRFWYSFYERGAVMADFCRRALVYMTGEALEELAKERTPELARRLLAELHARPWLLVLDGLERVLVAYHRIDAAEVPDEEANTPTDKVLRRDPCDTIRDEDGDLLRQLAGARPSKILVTSRLTPQVLINAAGQGIEGVKRFPLPGLRPADAEALLRSCGIEGDSAAIQAYLSENCDNHPLVIGVLAGLITNYLPRRGNFDAWAADAGPLGGARLNLAELDLIQRRNHILHAALAALPAKSQELLSTLALLSGSVDYETLAAFNPHLPAEPEEVAVPEKPEKQWWWRWDRMSEEEKSRVREKYEVALGRRREYEEALAAWRASAEVRAAPGRLGETVQELEQRGLLLFDRTAQRYDLHPVVRGVAAGGLQGEERERLGQRVVDHFSSVTHSPWEQAQTLEDLAPGLHVVRTLVKLGRWEEAGEAYRGDLSTSLLSALEDHSEVLALLRPFFPEGWSELPRELAPDLASYFANDA
ncbi:MAG: SIR2 family protein, partial [Thermoanaerobaculia bacterium]|nr:SIR2 family protein [Thermoanaerobaculia bacterium]